MTENPTGQDMMERIKILEKKEKQYSSLFKKMLNGFALHEMVLNEAAEPVDYLFLDVNTAFERMTGLKKENIIGKKVTQVLPGTEKEPADWIGRYGKVADTGVEIRFQQYSETLGKWYSVVAFSPQKGQFATIFEDITFQKEAESSLKAIEWLLKKTPKITPVSSQGYSDLTELNTCRMILYNIGKEMLSDIVTGYLELLETSAAVYEINGDYAHGIFSSGWCRMMDLASRKLCKTPDDKSALNSGKWLCHESCWVDASKTAIDTAQSVDIECCGGLRLYAVPILVHDQVIGAINFGYGDPPKDATTLEAISKKFQVDINDLMREADQYEHRPNFIIETAKKRLHSSAKLIGAMVESKLAQAKLQQEQERLHVTLQSIGDGVITTDIHGKVVLINKVAQNLTGWSLQDACGKDLIDVFDIINEQTQKPCENPVKKVLETNKVVELANHTILISQDGTRRAIADSAAPIIDGAKKTIGVVLVFRDMTEKVEMETALRQAHKMEAIGTMAGGIAHDFNNILYMITGNAELAMEDLPGWNPVHENLKEIKSAALRAAGVVKQLLNFTRQTDQELKPIGAVMVIKDALKFLRSTIPASIEIRQNFPDNELTILGDPTQLNQVMMNLCINASQAMEETGGILDIAVTRINIIERDIDSYPGLTPGDWLKITVSDTGPGIRSDIIKRIFDPYFTTKDVGKGSGMGLAVVHGIIKNHGGIISVESLPGNGTTFTIFIPVVNGKPGIDINSPDVIPKGTGERVLFVDDEVSITQMTGNMLVRLGYNVQTTTSPVDALELFRSEPHLFDLVLTDMTMPQMTGAKLSEKLKEIRPDISVIICTGHSSLIDEERAESIGIDGYVMKPIVMRDIAKTIRDVLEEAKKNCK
ncbi:putative Histidine kinase [Desulfamplus magnetovallimortis]|uniref:histidine kinase n=1 Tax=Desulfamplus magnetovallimortis TaxID=1246637 RepID=A0A1W1HKL5_9BACT|nr:response regulator [Desulfamplus magnetovallimortis]SLM33000.1 putative Histidine kinase [Desulfamplus magnetovallimortis]